MKIELVNYEKFKQLSELYGFKNLNDMFEYLYPAMEWILHANVEVGSDKE